jgi:hypothetical protein
LISSVPVVMTAPPSTPYPVSILRQVVAAYGVTGGFEPFRDLALGDGLAEAAASGRPFRFFTLWLLCRAKCINVR